MLSFKAPDYHKVDGSHINKIKQFDNEQVLCNHFKISKTKYISLVLAVENLDIWFLRFVSDISMSYRKFIFIF